MGRTSNNIVMDGDTMIDRRTGEVLNREVDSTYWKENFQPAFFSLYRLKLHTVEQEIHILNDIGTLDI